MSTTTLEISPEALHSHLVAAIYYLRMLHREGLPQVSKGMSREIVTTFGVLDELNDQIEQMIEKENAA